jgi:PAS domain S-box-containing protein
MWLSPVLLFSFLLVGNISIWQRTDDLSDELTRSQSLNTTEQVALRLENLLQERTNDLALLSSLWRNYPPSERTERFLTDATRIVQQEPAYHVINYVDDQSVIRSSAPPGRQPELVGLDLTTLPGREALHRQVRSAGVPLASPPITLTTGRLGTVIWFPISGEENASAPPGDMIAGAFHINEIVQRAVFPSASDEFWIRVELTDTTAYSTDPVEAQPAQHLERLGATTTISFLGQRWSVSAVPRAGGTFARLPQDNALRFGINVVLSLLASGLLGVAMVAVNRIQRSRQRLRWSEKRLRDIFEAAENVAFIMVDPAGTKARILEFSPGAEQIFGYRREEVIGQPVAMLHTPADVARFPEMFEAMRQRKAGFTGESTLVRKSGEEFPALFTTHPILDDEGDMVAAIGVSIDISERKQAEEGVRRYARRLETLHEIDQAVLAAHSPEETAEVALRHVSQLVACLGTGIVLFDAEAREAVLFALRAGEEIHLETGMRLSLEGIAGIEGLRHGEVIAEEDLLDLAHLPPTLQALKAINVRSYIAAPLFAQGDLIGALGLGFETPAAFGPEHADIVREVADQVALALHQARLHEEVQRQADELRAAVNRLQELDRLKNEFIQNVSHELRSPLALIRGYAEMLDTGELGSLDPEQQEPVAIIARRARMLSTLVQDVTLILGAKISPPEPEPVRLDELARAAVADFQISAAAAELVLETEIASDLPPVRGAPTHLRRVLDNLIGNAIKFTPPQGTISVSVKQLPKDQVLLEVSDTGIGIPPDQRDRIFERFYQVDGSTKRRYPGTGLGLALVKEIVETYGGEVRVESEVGEGSTFAITLPVFRRDDTPPEEASGT